MGRDLDDLFVIELRHNISMLFIHHCSVVRSSPIRQLGANHAPEEGAVGIRTRLHLVDGQELVHFLPASYHGPDVCHFPIWPHLRDIHLFDFTRLEDFLVVAQDGLQEAKPALPLFGQPVAHYMEEV